MLRYSLSLFLTSVTLFSTLESASQNYTPDWKSIDSRPIPKWFTNDKFGIFIHWGVYSVPSWNPADKKLHVYNKYAEWYWWRMTEKKDTNYFREFHERVYGSDFQYQDFASQFKAELFDPEKWASIFKQSGAKYVVLTSKHHEGFTLWPSTQSWNWNSVDIGPHRDLAGDLSEAVKKAGLRMGFYYSLYEWFNPLYKSNVTKYVDEHMMPQMKDLVTRYRPDIFWTDGEWEHNSDVWKSTQFLSWLYNESPVKESVVVNDRWGKETRGKHGGFYTTEYGLIHSDEAAGSAYAHPWEESRGIGSSYGYSRAESLEDYSSSTSLIHLLIDKVANGGNLLLDVGPTADGRIPVIMQQRLYDIGSWLRVNGEAIFETTPFIKSYTKESTVYYTTKGKTLYVILTRFPTSEIRITGLPNAPSKAQLLGHDKAVTTQYRNNILSIRMPTLTPADNPSPHAWVIKLENVLR